MRDFLLVLWVIDVDRIPNRRFELYSSGKTEAFMELYSQILDHGGPAFGAIFRHVKDKPAEGFLFHCTGRSAFYLLCRPWFQRPIQRARTELAFSQRFFSRFVGTTLQTSMLSHSNISLQVSLMKTLQWTTHSHALAAREFARLSWLVLPKSLCLLQTPRQL